MVPARISLVTLGVADVARSRTFYRSLGWETAIDMDEFAVFRTAGSFLALYPIADLTRDMGDDVPPGAPRRTALAINVASEEEVDAAIAEALAAGGCAAGRARACRVGRLQRLLRRSRRSRLGGRPQPRLAAGRRRPAPHP